MGLFFKADLQLTEPTEYLQRVARSLAFPDKMMRDVGEVVYDLIADSFDRESEPDGSPWADLAPSTIEQRTKKGLTPIRKLQATGRGERSISIDVKGATVEVRYGANNTEYMQHHRKGSDRLPKRDFIPSERAIERSPTIKKAVEKYINDSLRLR
jgi:phage gpG-like protein